MNLLYNKFITNLELVLLIQLEVIIAMHPRDSEFCKDFVVNFRKQNEKDNDMIFAKLSADKIISFVITSMEDTPKRWAFISKLKIKKSKMVSKEVDEVIKNAFVTFVNDLRQDYRYQFNGISAAGLYQQTEALLADSGLFVVEDVAKIREMLDWLLDYYVQAEVLKIVDEKYIHVDAQRVSGLTIDVVYENIASLMFGEQAGEYTREEIGRHHASRCIEFGAGHAEIESFSANIDRWLVHQITQAKLFKVQRGESVVYFGAGHASRIGYIDRATSDVAIIDTITENINHTLNKTKMRLTGARLKELSVPTEINQILSGQLRINGLGLTSDQAFQFILDHQYNNHKINVRMEEVGGQYTYGLPGIDYTAKPKLEDPVKFTLKEIEDRLAGHHWLTAYQITSQVRDKLIDAGSDQSPEEIQTGIEFVLEILLAQGKIEINHQPPTVMYRLVPSEKKKNVTDVLLDQLTEPYLLSLIDQIVKRSEHPQKLETIRDVFMSIVFSDHPHIKPSLALQGVFITMVHRAMKTGLIAATDGTSQEFKAPVAKTS